MASPVAERWITALRNRRFFEIGELTLAIRELLVKLNNRPFRKRDGSRASVFHGLDKSALHGLPADASTLASGPKPESTSTATYVLKATAAACRTTWCMRRSRSVPRPPTVKIFHKGRGVTSHFHSRGKGQMVTTPDHHPKSHREHLEWTSSRMVHWASGVGPTTARLFESILADQPHPEMGYRGCLGIIRLAEKYSGERT
ncbi:MAG: Integrase, catalytic region [Bryobacterales bacterium]|nr:Integrase, catalytic region [Bryobacterales bacterium]